MSQKIIYMFRFTNLESKHHFDWQVWPFLHLFSLNMAAWAGTWTPWSHYVRHDLFYLIWERLSNSYRKPWMKMAHRRKGIITRAPANLLGEKKITKMSKPRPQPEWSIKSSESFALAYFLLNKNDAKFVSYGLMHETLDFLSVWLCNQRLNLPWKQLEWDISIQMFKREIECLHIQWSLSCPFTLTS